MSSSGGGSGIRQCLLEAFPWVLGLLLIAGIFPVVTHEYLFMDGFFFREAVEFVPGMFLESQWQTGRPLNGLLQWAAFSPVHSVAQAYIVRTIGLLGVLVWYVLLTKLFRSRLSIVPASALAFLVATLPAFQVYAAWSVCAFYTLGAILGLYASVVCLRINPVDSGRRIVVRLLVGFLLLLAALLIYQPAAMTFWIPVLFFIGTDSPKSSWWRKGIAQCLVFGGALAIAYVVAVSAPVIEDPQGQGRSGLVADIAEKLVWFFSDPLRDAFNFQNIVPLTWLALVTFGIGIAGYLLADWEWKRKAIVIPLTLLLFPMSYLPSLLIAESWSSYRTQASLGAAAIIFVFLGIRLVWKRLDKVLPSKLSQGVGVICILLALGWAWSELRVSVYRYFVSPASMEWHYVQSLMFERITPETRKVIIRRAHWSDSVRNFRRYDEYGFPTSHPVWSAGRQIVQAARDNGSWRDNIEIVLLEPEQGLPDASEEVLVVDLRQIKEISKKR